MALGDLVVKLSADIADFRNDLGRAVHIAKRQSDQMTRAFNVATKAMGALGVGVSIAGLQNFIKESISAAAAQDDLAEKTGASVENMNRLSQQAFISGTEMSTIEMAMVRLAKSINENDEKAKRAAKALSALGLSAAELRRRDTADALKVVADRMNEFRDSSAKSALAVDLLGESGANVLPFLKDLANDQALVARITAEQAAKAEELEKAWRRLANEAKQVGQALSLELVPGMLRFIQAANDANRLQIDFGTKLLFANPFFSVNDSLERTREQLADAIKKKDEFFKRTGVNTQGQLDEIAKLEKRLEFFKGLQARDALALPGGDTPGEAQRFGLGSAKRALEYTSAVEKATKATKDNDLVLRQWLEDQEEWVRIMSEAAAATDKFAAQMRELEQQEEFISTFGRTPEQMKNWLNFIDAQREAEENAMRLAAGFDEAGNAIRQELSEWSEFTRQAARNMQSAMADGLFDVMQGRFDDMGSRFKATIDRMVADALAAKLLNNLFGPGFGQTGQIGGWIGQGFDWLKGISLPSAPALASSSTIDAAASMALPFLDEGTDYVKRSGLAMIHEGEAVVTKDENMSAGRMNVEQHFHFAAPTDNRTMLQVGVEAQMGLDRARRNR